MDTIGSIALWQRVERMEPSLCLRANRGCRRRGVKALFATVSRLGDGNLWYLLMLALVIGGSGTARVAAQMAVTGLIGAALYKFLKERLARERPYIGYAGIEPLVAPFDRYSFPSGHTLHAVCFTVLATTHLPELAPILIPFTLLVAASRVVLGSHYPTDVAAGAFIGASLASASLAVWTAQPVTPLRDGPRPDGADRLRLATLNSLRGLKHCYHSEAAFRQEVWAACVLVPLALWLGRTGIERALLVGSLLFVMIVELLNTGIEVVVDRISPERHRLSGFAKDLGSSAVLLALLLVVITWGLVLLDRLQ